MIKSLNYNKKDLIEDKNKNLHQYIVHISNNVNIVVDEIIYMYDNILYKLILKQNKRKEFDEIWNILNIYHREYEQDEIVVHQNHHHHHQYCHLV